MRFTTALANSWFLQALGRALLHSLWQGLLVALALWSALLVWRPARFRYAAGLAALAVMLGAFVSTLALSWSRTAPLARGPGGAVSVAVAAWESIPVGAQAEASRMELVAPWLSIFWAAGVCLCHCWQLAGLVMVRRLRRRGAWPAAEDWQAELARLGRRIGLEKSVALLESMMVSTPVVIGFLRPLVLVPAGLAARLPVEQVRAILLHELAHIRRHDYLVNLVQRWVEALFFYHPAMWWISRVIRLEREACCDELAVTVHGDRGSYAGALAALEETRFDGDRVPAMAATGGNLRLRIERLLQQSQPTGARGLISCVTIAVTTSVLAFAGWQSSPGTPGIEVKRAEATRVLAQVRPPAERAAANAGTEPTLFEKWLNEDVVYLISDAERVTFQQLKTDAERQMFVQQFWERAGGARARDEHYRRVAYADERFVEGAVPGWKTDRGRIYIVLGPPSEIESHTDDGYEMWRYGAGGKSAQFFTFADSGRTGSYRLQTPETPRPAAFNRLVRWTVVDPMNRYVTGLMQENFDLRERGQSKSMTYFEAPGALTAVAVVSGGGVAGLDDIPLDQPVIQTRTLEEAVDRLRSAAAVRKAVIVVREAGSREMGPLSVGMQGVMVDAGSVRATVVAIANQYVAGYVSESLEEPELVVKAVPGLPVLRINGPGR